MKKRLVTLFAAAAAVLLLVSGLWAPSASAAPAPALTQIRIIGVTSDGQSYQWENIGPNQISASKPMKGTTGYLAVYFQGYPNNNTIQAFNNGTNITNLTSKALEDEYTKTAISLQAILNITVFLFLMSVQERSLSPQRG